MEHFTIWLRKILKKVEFIREERFAGETKYPLKKMVKFALDALTSFSYKPLKLATYIGATISAFSFLYMVFVLFENLFTSLHVQGWTFIVAISLLFNGLMFIILGIIGEYVGRIYDEAKGRPLYIIGEKEGFK